MDQSKGATLDELPVHRSVDLPHFEEDLYSDDNLRDPYPLYERMRDAGPVVWLKNYSVYGVSRYQDVRDVLNRPSEFCSGAGVGLTNLRKEKSWRTPSLILEADRPEHTPRRKVLARIFSPIALKALRPEFEAQAARFIDDMVSANSCDGVRDLAEAYPLKVFGDAVGIRAEGRHHLLPYGDLVFNAFGPINPRFEERMAESAETLEWITESCKRENLEPYGFGAKLYEAADAGEISDGEAALLVRTLLSAGLDTTVFTLANMISTLARHPVQWAHLQADPSLMRSALEETMRFESTFQSFYRTTTSAVEIAGTNIPADQKVWISIASGNRDDRQWPEANLFDVRRRVTGTLAFGTGIHACVGQMIARLEAEVVLTALVSRVSKFDLTGEPEVHFNNTVRGFSSCPLQLTAR